MKNTIVKAILLYNNPTTLELLVLTRVSTAKVYPGMEDLPGGKINPNESLFHAIARETTEETKLIVTDFEFLTQQEYITP